MKNLQFYNPESFTNVGAHFTVYNGEGLEFKGVFTSIILDLCENFLKWIYSAENGSQGGFFYDSLDWLCKDPGKRSKGKFPFKLIILENVICKRPLEANVYYGSKCLKMKF